MYLLFDECCGKALVKIAEDHGHTAQRTSEVAMLGRGAADNDIFDFARRQGAVLVTVNRGDFISLAGLGLQHPGVILIPSLPTAKLRPLFLAVVAAAEAIFDQGQNQFVEVDTHGAITSFTLP
jgi:predicted nuclease of predicted toxin-antitoxin system